MEGFLSTKHPYPYTYSHTIREGGVREVVVSSCSHTQLMTGPAPL